MGANSHKESDTRLQTLVEYDQQKLKTFWLVDRAKGL